jgi:hypothetical protein
MPVPVVPVRAMLPASQEAEGTMQAFEVQRVVEASQEQAFEVYSDVTRAKEYLRGVTRIEMLSPGPVGQGTRWRETRLMFGREATEELWIERFDAPRAYSVAAESNGVRYLTTFTFEPAPARGAALLGGETTLVTLRFESTPLTRFARVFGLLLGRALLGTMRKALAQDLDDLAAACRRSPVAA